MAQNVVVPPFDVAPETVVGSTPQSVFPFDFPYWGESDIRVYVDNTPLLDTAFSVEGYAIQNGEPVDGGFGSGAVTLVEPVSNCVVTIDRFVQGSRESQFGRSAPLLMPALNADLNKLTGRQQDLNRILDRVPQTAPGETPPTWEQVLTAAGLVGSEIGSLPIVPTGGDTGVTLAGWRGLVLPPEAFGAVADVETEAASDLTIAALNKAVEAGVIIDGGGRTYAIHGRWTPTHAPKLRNIRFKQIATTGSARDIMVALDGLNDVDLENVVFDLNNIPVRSGVSFASAYGVHVKNAERFRVKTCRVINGGAHSGWLFEGCSGGDFIDSDARDFDAAFLTEPTDDVACGVAWANCTNVRVWGGRPGNISASWPSQPSPRRLYARGMSFSGCSVFHVRGTQVDFVDQGFDTTGGGSNHDLYFWDIAMSDCSTFGFKASNRCYNIFVNGFEITRPGWAGTHVTSSVSSGATPYVQNIRFSRGHVDKCGANSIYTSSDGRNAYQIVHTGLTPGYPAGVTYDGCTWTDDQTVKTTDAGFAQRGTITPRTPTTTIPMNRVLPNCSGEGLAVGGVPQLAMNFPSATATGNSTPVALAHNTLVPLVFSVPVYDPSVMIDTVNGRIYAHIDGDYDAGIMASFQNAAAGIGELFFFKNGSEVGANYRAAARLDPTYNARVEMVRPIAMKRGDYISFQCRQQSGSAMNITLNAALCWLRLRNPFS